MIVIFTERVFRFLQQVSVVIKSESPQLSRIARIILSVPASSATSERCFPEARFTIKIRRTRLDPKNDDKLLFIRSAKKCSAFGEEDVKGSKTYTDPPKPYGLNKLWLLLIDKVLGYSFSFK